MKHLVYLAILLFCPLLNPAQVVGEWIKVSVESLDPSLPVNPNSIKERSYEKLYITLDSVFLTLSPICDPFRYKHRIDGDTIWFSTQEKTFKRSGDTLYLYDTFVTKDPNSQPLRKGYIRIPSWRKCPSGDGYPVIVMDTLRILDGGYSDLADFQILKASTRKHVDMSDRFHCHLPYFNNHTGHFIDYIQDFLLFRFKHRDPHQISYLEFSLRINSDGIAEDFTFLKHDNERLKKDMTKILKSRKNKWVNPGNSDIVLVFPFIVEPAAVLLQKADLIRQSDRQFHNGHKKFEQDLYFEAIDHFNRSLDLWEENVSALFYRGASYFSINQAAKACLDWNTIYDLGYNESYKLLMEHCQKYTRQTP